MITITAVQSQKAVSAHFTSKQILPFGFAEHYTSYIAEGITDVLYVVSFYNLVVI